MSSSSQRPPKGPKPGTGEPEPDADVIDPDLGIAVKDLNLFNGYWHARAVMASEDPRPNAPEEQAADDELYARCLETLSKSPAEVRVERARARAQAVNANVATKAKIRDELVLGASEADIRLVDAYFHELALDASNDPSPPTREEQIANAESVAAFERLKAMTPDELRAERARRIQERRRRDGR